MCGNWYRSRESFGDDNALRFLGNAAETFIGQDESIDSDCPVIIGMSALEFPDRIIDKFNPKYNPEDPKTSRDFRKRYLPSIGFRGLNFIANDILEQKPQPEVDADSATHQGNQSQIPKR